jgi:hypothetical protein
MKGNKPHHQKNILTVVDLVEWVAGIIPGMGTISTKSIDITGNFYPLIIRCLCNHHPDFEKTLKANKSHHQKNILMVVDLVDWVDVMGWARRGEGSENRHHFPPRVTFSDPSPLRVMPK